MLNVLRKILILFLLFLVLIKKYILFVMEVSVYMNLESKRSDKPVFKRMVVSPDVFDYSAFIKSMKSVFGNSCVIDLLIV